MAIFWQLLEDTRFALVMREYLKNGDITEVFKYLNSS
jgi:hypothetical protein